MKVLCILSTPKPIENSYGKKMTKTFIDEYKRLNPKDQVDEIDLYKDHYPALTNEDIEEAINKGKGKMVEEAKRFSDYDKYIIQAPLWNLSVPSALKSYIDHIVTVNVTFKYNKLGIPTGLLKDKSVFYIGTRGGYYPFPISCFAHDKSYIKFIFKFIGIKKFKGFVLEGIDQKPEKVKIAFDKTLEKIKVHAQNF